MQTISIPRKQIRSHGGVEYQRPDHRVRLISAYLVLIVVSTRPVHRFLADGDGSLQSRPQDTRPHNQVMLRDLVSRFGSLHLWYDSTTGIARLSTLEDMLSRKQQVFVIRTGHLVQDVTTDCSWWTERGFM